MIDPFCGKPAEEHCAQDAPGGGTCQQRPMICGKGKIPLGKIDICADDGEGEDGEDGGRVCLPALQAVPLHGLHGDHSAPGAEKAVDEACEDPGDNGTSVFLFPICFDKFFHGIYYDGIFPLPFRGFSADQIFCGSERINGQNGGKALWHEFRNTKLFGVINCFLLKRIIPEKLRWNRENRIFSYLRQKV